MNTVDDLVISHLNLANSVAWKRKQVLRNFDIDELKSAAYFGLCVAAKKFNPAISHFPHYARIKIDGAIGDYIREVRGRTHKLESMDDETCNAIVQKISFEDILNQIIENLCEKGKNIMRMYYLEGLNHKEISAKLNVGESRVSQILSKYRQQIQEEYVD